MPEQQHLKLLFEERHSRLITPDEIYHTADDKLLRIIKEDRRIERKPAGIHVKALSEYLSMWANTPSDGGIIALGIENDGIISGICEVGVSHINSLEKAGTTSCHDAEYETKHIPVKNYKNEDDAVLLIRVHFHKTKVVRTSDGRAFNRVGDSKIQLKEEEIREKQIDKGELSVELEDSRLSYPDDFDTAAISDFVLRVIEERNLKHQNTNEEVLVNRRLGRVSNTVFVPNLACALTFAKDPIRETPGCKIRFLRFEGNVEGSGARFNAVKEITLEGSVPRLIVGCEDVLGGQLREFSRLGKDGTFYTSPEYPKDAWYEAIVNACCHRSYNLKNQPIFVKLFDNRFEVESPGGFMPFVTPENIYSQHHPRNPILMDALYHLKYVKCAAEGTRRMKETMQKLDLPIPEFSQKNEAISSVRVVLRNNIEQRKVWLDASVSPLVGEALFQTLSPHEKRVINYAAEYKSISVSQAQRLTSLSWPAAKRVLELLEKRGLVYHKIRENLERDPQARYFLINFK